MVSKFSSICMILAVLTCSISQAQVQEWTQWRGPNRDGVVNGEWPASLDEGTLVEKWSVSAGPSYSGPIVVGDKVFITETRDKKVEVVTALNREDGSVAWTQTWEGSITVPFFAKANGSWIRATPCYDDGMLYVSGIKDHLVCLNASNGDIVWKMDFPKMMGTGVPQFGAVCSPLIDGDFLYIQAGPGFVKLDKKSGQMVWKTLEVGGGMMGGAFSSPLVAEIQGKKQILVQTRQKLAGVDPENGNVLWEQAIPNFRGMNIQTPVTFEDSLFVSTYRGTTQLIDVKENSGNYELSQRWNLGSAGYMTTPIVVNGHAYNHLQNRRFACYDLKNGKETWRSQPFGKYASLVSNGKYILALNDGGELFLLNANPEKFDIVSRRKVANDSWAHIAVRGDEIFIRDLKEMTVYTWKGAK